MRLHKQRVYWRKEAKLPERALSDYRNMARSLARAGSPMPLHAANSQNLTGSVRTWFYKKGCQEKKLLRELEAAT
jgi:hypothetical protein